MVGGVEGAFGTEGELAVLDKGFAAFGEMIDEAVPPGAQGLLVLRVAREVAELAWVSVEVEELFFSVSRVKDVFEVTVGQRVPMVFRPIADIVFEIDVGTPAFGLAARYGK